MTKKARSAGVSRPNVGTVVVARFAQANACPRKHEARQAAEGWRSPPHPRRERGAKAPEVPEDETPATQQEVGEEVDTEVEMEVEPTPEGTEE